MVGTKDDHQKDIVNVEWLWVVMEMTASVVVLIVPCMWRNKETVEMCPV